MRKFTGIEWELAADGLRPVGSALVADTAEGVIGQLPPRSWYSVETEEVFSRASSLLRGTTSGNFAEELWVATTAWFRNTPIADFDLLHEERRRRIKFARAIRQVAPDLGVLPRHLEEAGCRGYKDAVRFLEIWGKVAAPGRSVGSRLNPSHPMVQQLARALLGSPTWVVAQCVRAGVNPRRPGDSRKLFYAARAWTISPLLWKGVAVRVGRMPLWARLTAAGICDQLAADHSIEVTWSRFGGLEVDNEWQTNRSLRLEFWQRFQVALSLGQAAALTKWTRDSKVNRWRVLGLVHRKVDMAPELAKRLIGSAGVAALVGLKLGAWLKAQAALATEAGSNGDWTYSAATGLVAVFGRDWARWLEKNRHLDRGAHDATYWLPHEVAPLALEGLSSWLYRFGDREISELSVVAKNWAGVSPEDRRLSYRVLLAKCRSRRYVGQRSDAFAAEAALWSVPEEKYKTFEDLYVSSQKVPETFDSSLRFSVGTLTGRFLPRSDVRVGFFGQHTDCCQHLEGLGRSCAVSTMADSFSQLFVVENKDGRILAGSWTWETTMFPEGNEERYRAVCFDNVEALKLSGAQVTAIQAIYSQVGNHLADQGYRKVTIGMGLTDVLLECWTATQALTLPPRYSGYTDAADQVLLAENLNAPVIPAKAQVKVWVRGALEVDLEAAQGVARACYPAGSDSVSLPEEDMRGLVLMHQEAGVIGYATWDETNREIADLAVHPKYREHSRLLCLALMAHCRESGEWWTAEARASTTFRLLQLFARRRRIELITSGQGDPVGDEPTYHVRFRAI